MENRSQKNKSNRQGRRGEVMSGAHGLRIPASRLFFINHQKAKGDLLALAQTQYKESAL